ncbi:MAG TPA: phosphatidylserine/phosphatidylglycerophosphate/cardiolipin synthase family protein [Vicinamibacterales bacterium]|nr:phosphatidylserine/phosphatidylglycerophosphate/cardiolipin synthase family protein [Vicinamibacterales bacterium]
MRLLKKVAVGIVGAVLAVYLVFAIGLTVLEWVVRENPRVENSLLAHSVAPHTITHFDRGAASFQRRLELIASARKSIALEFFIYDVDDASRLLTQALIRKAREGVQVRILVDFSAPVFKLKPAYARLLGEAGVQVRYYNTSAFYRVVSVQHRSHRKLLIIDETTVLTGGRNIGNDYFDLSDRYNFLDSDLEVSGPIVKTVLQSFDVYWNSRLAADPAPAPEPDDEAAKFVVPQAGDAALLDRLRAVGESYRQSHAAHECRDLRFVTDFPNQGEASRNVFKAIVEELGRAKQEAVVESPYFVIKSGGYAVLEDLHRRGVRVRVLTNSLASTDASYSVAALYPWLGSLADTGLTLSAYGGAPLPSQGTNLRGGTPRWGLHSKRGVIDGETTLLGTYNMDPRSANLNSELMFVCRGQKDLAADVLASIAAREAASARVIERGRIVQRSALLGGSPLSHRIRFLLEMPIANLFDFLL